MDYVKDNNFGYSIKVGKTCTWQCTYRSKNRPIPSSEYAPYLSHDMFGINLTHSLNTVAFITTVSRVLVLAQGVSQMVPNYLFNTRHFFTYM